MVLSVEKNYMKLISHVGSLKLQQGLPSLHICELQTATSSTFYVSCQMPGHSLLYISNLLSARKQSECCSYLASQHIWQLACARFTAPPTPSQGCVQAQKDETDPAQECLDEKVIETYYGGKLDIAMKRHRLQDAFQTEAWPLITSLYP